MGNMLATKANRMLILLVILAARLLHTMIEGIIPRGSLISGIRGSSYIQLFSFPSFALLSMPVMVM